MVYIYVILQHHFQASWMWMIRCMSKTLHAQVSRYPHRPPCLCKIVTACGWVDAHIDHRTSQQPKTHSTTHKNACTTIHAVYIYTAALHIWGNALATGWAHAPATANANVLWNCTIASWVKPRINRLVSMWNSINATRNPAAQITWLKASDVCVCSFLFHRFIALVARVFGRIF